MSEIKRGDEPIVVWLLRTTKGLQVTVRCHEIVEEFFRIASGGDVTPVAQFGRGWIGSDGKTSTDLAIYNVVNSALNGTHQVNNKLWYRLDQAGRQLSVAMPGGRCINLSFLLLQGSSADGGIVFYIPGVFSNEEVDRLGAEIHDASQRMYLQYMKPMEISLEIKDELPPMQKILTADVQGV